MGVKDFIAKLDGANGSNMALWEDDICALQWSWILYLRLMGQEKKLVKEKKRERSVIYDFLRQNYLKNPDLDFHSQIYKKGSRG